MQLPLADAEKASTFATQPRYCFGSIWGKSVNQCPKTLAVIHVAKMGDLVCGHVVLDEMWRHHETPTKSE